MTDADRQPAVEAAARLCYLTTLAVMDLTLTVCFYRPVPSARHPADRLRRQPGAR
jgi:hypothetical protein